MKPFRAMGTASGGGGGGGYNAETVTWYTRIAALGASVTTTEKNIADALIVAIQGATLNSKIIALYPYLGSTILAASVPLRDAKAKGAATITGFVDSDIGDAVGIKNITTAVKGLNTNYLPSELGTSMNGGLFFYERAFIGTGTNSEMLGMSYSGGGDNRHIIDVRTASNRFFSWGLVANRSGDTTAGASGFYYGQRSSATDRRLYLNGVQLGSTNTTSDAATFATHNPIYLMGAIDDSTFKEYSGTCGVAGMTDGTLTPTEVVTLQNIIDTYLITPTGR